MPVCGKSGSHRPSSIDEQLDCGRPAQWAHGHQDFARNAERLAARRDQPQTRHRSDQRLGQGCRLIYHVFTVVEDDQKRPPGQVAHDELHRRVRRRRANEAGRGHPECAGHSRRNPVGLGDVRELDQPGPVSVLLAQCGGQLYRQSGLAHPTGTDQRHQPARADRLAQLLEFRCATDEAAQSLPQVARCHRRRNRLETCRAGCGE